MANSRTAGRGGKQKGDAYERELATHLTLVINGWGFNNVRVSRAPLSGGGFNRMSGAGAADLTGLPGVHVEAKRTERLNFWEAHAQALRNVTGGDVPVVMTRRSRLTTGQSLVTLTLDDFLIFYKAWLTSEGVSQMSDKRITLTQ